MTIDPTDLGDDEILNLLRRSLGGLAVARPYEDDRLPDSVLEGAKWVHEWLNMEAELAELTFDSSDNLELAGARSMGPLRELTFVSGHLTIELEIEPGGRTVEISGTIDPPVAGKMQVVVGGEVFGAAIGPDGSFAISGVANGTVLAFVDTPTGKIRLGSFEV